jgi:hypothetical protein
MKGRLGQIVLVDWAGTGLFEKQTHERSMIPTGENDKHRWRGIARGLF